MILKVWPKTHTSSNWRIHVLFSFVWNDRILKWSTSTSRTDLDFKTFGYWLCRRRRTHKLSADSTRFLARFSFELILLYGFDPKLGTDQLVCRYMLYHACYGYGQLWLWPKKTFSRHLIMGVFKCSTFVVCIEVKDIGKPKTMEVDDSWTKIYWS